MSSANQVLLKGPEIYEEAYAAAAFKPGHLIRLNSDGKLLKHDVLGGGGEYLFAKEDALQGNTLDDAFAADDLVPYLIATRGNRIQARLPANAAAVAIHDKLISDGGGCLIKSVSQLVFSQIVESTEHENTIAAADFDQSVTIPANTLEVGDIIKIRAQVTVNDDNAADTLTLLLTLGGETIADSGAVDVATGDVGYFDAEITVRAIGAAGEIQAAGVVALGVPGTVTAKAFAVNDVTVNTAGALKIAVNADWSAAHADNEASLSLLNVQILRSGANAGSGAIMFEAMEAVDNSAGAAEAFIDVRAM